MLPIIATSADLTFQLIERFSKMTFSSCAIPDDCKKYSQRLSDKLDELLKEDYNRVLQAWFDSSNGPSDLRAIIGAFPEHREHLREIVFRSTATKRFEHIFSLKNQHYDIDGLNSLAELFPEKAAEVIAFSLVRKREKIIDNFDVFAKIYQMAPTEETRTEVLQLVLDSPQIGKLHKNEYGELVFGNFFTVNHRCVIWFGELLPEKMSLLFTYLAKWDQDKLLKDYRDYLNRLERDAADKPTVISFVLEEKQRLKYV
jgi:hypothetical protein